MGKVLSAIFDDEEIDINELILFLKKNSQVVLMDDFSNDGLLNYGNIVIDSKLFDDEPINCYVEGSKMLPFLSTQNSLLRTPKVEL